MIEKEEQESTKTNKSTDAMKKDNFKKHFSNKKKNNTRPKRHNDPGWYEVSPELTRDVASIPFNIITGSGLPKVNVPNSGTTIAMLGNDFSDCALPGVFAIRYVPTIGTSAGPTSAVNVAGRSIYSWVRHQNSGHSNYEAVDLLDYILAMDSIYTEILQAKIGRAHV